MISSNFVKNTNTDVCIRDWFLFSDINKTTFAQTVFRKDDSLTIDIRQLSIGKIQFGLLT